MEYYGNNDWRDYLALKHHGIVGMKWGKRNGPPYPLGYGDHSSAEKKSNPKGKLDNYEPTGQVKKKRVTGSGGGIISTARAKHAMRRVERSSNKAAKAYVEANKSRRIQSIKNPVTGEKSSFLITNTKKDNEANEKIKKYFDDYAKAVERANDAGYDLKSNSKTGKLELVQKNKNKSASGERNQIKEEVRKRASKETDDGLRDKLRELDQKYFEAHRADNYKEREKYGDMISDLRDDYISKSKDKARAEKEFDRINDEVMSKRTEPQQKKSPAAGVDEYINSINNGKKIAKTVLADPSRKLTQQELWDLDDYVEQLLFTGTKGGPGEEWYSKKEEEEYYKLRKYVDKKLGY